MPSKTQTKSNQDKIQLLRDFERAGKVAIYYGFTPSVVPNMVRSDKTRSFKRVVDEVTKLDEETYSIVPFLIEEKVSLLYSYLDRTPVTEDAPLSPIITFHKHTNFIKRASSKEVSFGLDIVGVSDSIADAIIIKTTLAILEEEGFKNLCVEINCLGDKDSLEDCERELTNYVRKHLAEFPDNTRQAVKRDVFELLRREPESNCDELRNNAPTPLNTLSEKSRNHFKEVLEYLETLQIPFVINPHLVGNKLYGSHTIFRIKIEGDEKNESRLEATGMRYNHLGRKAGLRHDVPAIGASISYRKTASNSRSYNYDKLPKPKFCFVHLGFEAKLKCLHVIDHLRKINVRLFHTLTRDELSSQFMAAEKHQLPYVIIMGQKEALENNVVIRDNETRTQEIVSMNDLVPYFKERKF